jgi:Fic family protein
VVLGASRPIELRATDAVRGSERYGAMPGLRAAFERVLADTTDRSLALPVRAARAYLDVCFFHPFADGNGRAARLVLDHLLTAGGSGIAAARPLFSLARLGRDQEGARSFVTAVGTLCGPFAMS